MRVPNGDDTVRAGRRRPGECLCQLSPGGRRGPRDIVRVSGVDRSLQREQDLGPPTGVQRQLVHQSRQRPDVGAQLPYLYVPEGLGELLDHIQRRVDCGSWIPVGSSPEAGVRDVGVGRGLEVELDGFSLRDREVVVERRDGLDHASGRPIRERLSLEAGGRGEAEVDHHLGLGRRYARPVGRHLADGMDPERAPRFAPCRPNVDRREVLPGRICKGNWLAGHAPGRQRQRSAGLVDGWFQVVADETVQAGFEQQSVIVHEVLVGVGARAQLTLIQTT